MKKKVLMSIVLSAALLLSGCRKAADTDVSETVPTETTAVETTVSETTAETTVTTTETTIETTAETTVETTAETTEETTAEAGIGAGVSIDSISGFELIKNAKTGDGYITHNRDNISDGLETAGISEKALSAEEVISDAEEDGVANNIYHFTMMNTEDVKGYEGSDETVYMTSLYLGEDTYIVTYGTDATVAYEDVLPYCSAGKMVEYWAFATVSGDNIILVPFIAGTETTGYYLVIPTIEQMGLDVSEMYIPEEPVGEDFDLSDYGAVTTESSDNGSSISAEQTEGSLELIITSVENDPELTLVNCTFINKFDHPLCIIGEKLVVNGEDCTDKFTAFFNFRVNETLEDCFYLDYMQLQAGDKLEITFSAQDYDTFEELGTLHYELELENIG